MTAPCCSLAKSLTARRLADLDEELRTPAHRSFRKLADAYGVPGQKSAIERHKHRCLGLAAPLDSVPKVELPKDLPVVEAAPRRKVGTAVGTVPSVPKVSQEGAARARAPEVAMRATSHEEKVLYVVSQMTAGTWDGPRGISKMCQAWDLDRDTVRKIAGEAALVCRIDRGTVEDRRQASMGYWRRLYEEAMIAAASPAEFDAPSKCLAVAATAQTGWDKAGGVYDDSAKVLNIFSDPRFVEAAKRYVDVVRAVMDDAGALIDRVEARLGRSVPLDVVAAILAEADAEIAARVQGPPPPMLGAA